MSNKIAVTGGFDGYLNEFKSLWSQGMKCLVDACKVYVKAIDELHDGKQQFQEALPEIPHGMWNRFESVGRGTLHPKLFFETGAGFYKLLSFPVSEQRKAIEEGVEVLTVDGTNLKVSMKNLTPNQVKQVFDSNHIRSVAEQRAWIESEKAIEEAAKKRARQPKPLTYKYDVKERALVIYAPCTFSLRQLKKILKDAGEL